MMFLFNRVPRFVLWSYPTVQFLCNWHMIAIWVLLFRGFMFLAPSQTISQLPPTAAVRPPQVEPWRRQKQLLSRGMKGGKPCWVLLGLWFPWFSYDEMIYDLWFSYFGFIIYDFKHFKIRYWRYGIWLTLIDNNHVMTMTYHGELRDLGPSSWRTPGIASGGQAAGKHCASSTRTQT